MSLKTTVRSFAANLTMSKDDVRALLYADHLILLDLAKRMHESKSGSARRSLFNRLKPALVSHSRSEEKQVYQALLKLRSKDSHAYGNEGFVEHSVVDALMARLEKGDAEADLWQAQAKVLFELLHHHIGEEQTDVFSDMGGHFNADELAAMGERFTAGKQRILAALATQSKRKKD